MKRLWMPLVVLALVGGPALGQHVGIQKPNRLEVRLVRTALNHLTVLEMREPVSAVAVGSAHFKVEWRENKVFILPTESNVSTNLFVWTASDRFNYELEPAGPVQQMDFAIDQPPPEPQPSAMTKPVTKETFAGDVLIEARPIRLYGSLSNKRGIVVYLNDLLPHDGTLLIRYTVRNESVNAYSPGVPQVVTLDSPRYRESLYSLAACQLGAMEASRVKSNGQTGIRVSLSRMAVDEIPPGQQATGLVVIPLPKPGNEPQVLRLFFSATTSGPVYATLVL